MAIRNEEIIFSPSLRVVSVVGGLGMIWKDISDMDMDIAQYVDLLYSTVMANIQTPIHWQNPLKKFTRRKRK